MHSPSVSSASTISAYSDDKQFTMRIKYGLYLSLFLGLNFTASAKSKGPIRVACIGNSITYGYGLADREHEAYPVLLQQKLGAKYQVENFGKSGATLLARGHRPYFQQEEYKKALAFRPDSSANCEGPCH